MNLYENIKGNLKESNKEELVNSLINYLYDTYGDNFKLEDNVNGYTKNEEIYEMLVTQYLEEKPDISFVEWVKNIIEDPHGLLVVKGLNEAVEVGYDDYYDFENDGEEDTLYCDECGQPVKVDFCYVSDETDPNPEIYCWPCHDKLVANGSLIDSEEE